MGVFQDKEAAEQSEIGGRRRSQTERCQSALVEAGSVMSLSVTYRRCDIEAGAGDAVSLSFVQLSSP